ncbi:type II secretion system protein GspM [Gilvimarinus polysaccharolyticus]|uniref:type II secretion system protein GspM n=1 Tax=Gilvimarinus polysaccharolyticus TaxID=863921 RepID=UPI0006735FAD|nr:type II secretion system protein GspM [Gilvimarinus polysaccharolyticus]
MESLEKLKAYLDGLTLRERVIVLLAAILVIYGLWFVLWYSGASNKREATAQRIGAIAAEQQKIENQIVQFQQAGGGTAEVLKAELSLAKHELVETNKRLSRSTSALVSADQLAQVLQDMLRESNALALISLQMMNVEPISLKPLEEQDSNEWTGESVNVYRHGVELTVRGRYFEVLDLLDQLEAKPWKFYWKSLHYHVQSYPAAEVTIRVYTLSAEEGRLGV